MAGKRTTRTAENEEKKKYIISELDFVILSLWLSRCNRKIVGSVQYYQVCEKQNINKNNTAMTNIVGFQLSFLLSSLNICVR